MAIKSQTKEGAKPSKPKGEAQAIIPQVLPKIGKDLSKEQIELLRTEPKVVAVLDLFKQAADGCRVVEEKLNSAVVALHDANLNPKEQRAVLFMAGFNPQRSSEIMRICNDSDDRFQAYKDKLVGYRLALDCARNDAAPGEVETKKSKANNALLENWTSCAVTKVRFPAVSSFGRKERALLDFPDMTLEVICRIKPAK